MQNENSQLAFGKFLKDSCPKWITDVSVWQGELTVTVVPSEIRNVILFLRDNTLSQYKLLIDITAVDYLSRDKRFAVVYQLLSVSNNSRICVKTHISETEILPSIVPIHNSASWLEREVWDMFGIFFSQHPDLRRILTDYGFQGYPLRKDFPLTGYVEVRYDDEEKRVVCEPVEMTQEFRSFNFVSPWEEKN